MRICRAVGRDTVSWGTASWGTVSWDTVSWDTVSWGTASGGAVVWGTASWGAAGLDKVDKAGRHGFLGAGTLDEAEVALKAQALNRELGE